jgi:hypothetical protein
VELKYYLVVGEIALGDAHIIAGKKFPKIWSFLEFSKNCPN